MGVTVGVTSASVSEDDVVAAGSVSDGVGSADSVSDEVVVWFV